MRILCSKREFELLVRGCQEAGVSCSGCAIGAGRDGYCDLCDLCEIVETVDIKADGGEDDD